MDGERDPATTSLDEVLERVAARHPRRLRGRRAFKEAGVAAVLRARAEDGTPEVLFMRRARRRGDPWSGHMSFPGGRRHADDADVLEAARRETAEETGLDLARDATVVGALSDVVTRTHEKPLPMLVRPYVFRVEGDPELRTNHEAEELVWMPLAFFADRRNRERIRWRLGRIQLRLPAYTYEGRTVWGLTLMMLDELVYVAYGRSFARWGWLQALRAHERPVFGRAARTRT